VKLESPAKLAEILAGYVPALIPEMLTLLTKATPEASVIALPTPVPFSENEILFPLTGEPLDVSVARRFTVPLKGPLAGVTAVEVGETTNCERGDEVLVWKLVEPFCTPR